MSERDDFSDGEFEMAVAAAAFAIVSLEENGSLKQKSSDKGSGSSLTTTESKTEDNTIKPTDSSRLSFEEAKDGKSAVSGDNFMKQTAEANQRMLQESAANHKNKDKPVGAIPTVRKTPTFTDKHLNDSGGTRSESGKEMRTGSKAPSIIKPKTSLSGKKNWDRNSAEPSEVEEAYVWEKEEMIKIKNRYEKTNATILDWENEKKTKAKQLKEQKEGGLEQRRAKALQEYRDEMSWIDKITGGARALADERKRNAEYKARKKAQVMISTGKSPRACFCF